jgi:Phage integrase SAM-like domain
VNLGCVSPREAQAEKTVISEREAIAKFKEFFAGIALARLDKADIQRYINWRLESLHARRGTPISPATINLELRYLKHILNYAVDDELIETSPFKRSLVMLPAFVRPIALELIVLDELRMLATDQLPVRATHHIGVQHAALNGKAPLRPGSAKDAPGQWGTSGYRAAGDRDSGPETPRHCR